jgi:hypothetical protein
MGLIQFLLAEMDSPAYPRAGPFPRQKAQLWQVSRASFGASVTCWTLMQGERFDFVAWTFQIRGGFIEFWF